MNEQLQESDAQAIEKLKGAYDGLRNEVAKIIVGQEKVLDQVLIALFAKGHALLVGVPGLAKTLMIKTISEALSLEFNRIQFTPDLMPSDITGTEVIREDKATGERSLKFLEGPIFTNMLLADEINRTPPKTQAALLEAMQEGQVSIGGQRHPLSIPFFVLATQNPIEQEGTYPLPEAQLDRFMFNIVVDYPTQEEELEIMRRTTSSVEVSVSQTLSAADILQLQSTVRRIPIADSVARYAVALVRATRVLGEESVPPFVKEWVQWGAGPRASQYLILGAKVHAALHGNHYVSTDDIRAVAHPVLYHRILTNFSAQAEGISTTEIIHKLLEIIPTNISDKVDYGKLPQVLGSSGS